jgi:ABC-type oligopeptide transport system substrate-binding subunit
MDPANQTKIDIANPHIYDVEMESYAWLAYDPTSTYQQYSCALPQTNYPHYCNQDYDKTMNDAVRTLDDQKAVQLYQKVQTIMTTELPSMPIWIEPEIWAISKKLHGGVLARGPLNNIQPELWWKE